ncbi:hypothetical protein B9Z45_13160 [Limnohabitans sp. 2KL-17]|uniref:cyclic peptide export ABC transporter n=1 Tax=Limnohabitans sp. 2KL-17 TaxID=1100704 RepID=UPI000D3B3052|nr:cyclic peptide export ABC transporter [Limnohabitans sp. 2KL-17]PUE53042.1 hypothetical protein B9Z45_13160 [Limnohabitans sp. 2KL-17]
MSRHYRKYLELTGLRSRQILAMVVYALSGGALGTALVTLLAETVKRGLQEAPGPLPMAGFAAALLAYLWLQRGAARRMISASEHACEKLRQRILHAILHATLLQVEVTPAHVARLALTRDAVQLSSAIPVWVAMLTSIATVLCTLGYLVWLSPRSAAVVGVVIVIAVLAYQLLIRRTFPRMREAYELANAGMGFADDVLLGVKELKLDPAYARHFWHQDLQATLRRASAASVEFKSAQHDVGLVGVVAFYGLAGLAAFGFARLLKVDPAVVGSVVLVLMFLQAHIQGVVQRLPTLADAGLAQARIESMLQSLESSSEDLGATAAEASPATDWRTLRLEAVSFSYAAEPGANGFSLREVDLEIPRGATVFIVGGNGSGKTTLAKILLGLYRPHIGRVLLDDVPLDDASVLAYRSQFCSVFSDVHLFRRAPQSDPGFDDDLLRRILGELSLPLRLDAEGRLDVRALSQGQKKRMASAFAMTDRRPLCLFDEWTADQDPEFRRYFYETFLPRLREEGRTVIVITHDDRQFHRADLLVHLDAGRIVDVRRQVQALPFT